MQVFVRTFLMLSTLLVKFQGRDHTSFSWSRGHYIPEPPKRPKLNVVHAESNLLNCEKQIQRKIYLTLMSEKSTER